MKYGRQQAEETIDFRHPRQDCTAEGLPSLKGRAEWGRYMIFADHSGLDTRQREAHASPRVNTSDVPARSIGSWSSCLAPRTPALSHRCFFSKEALRTGTSNGTSAERNWPL